MKTPANRSSSAGPRPAILAAVFSGTILILLAAALSIAHAQPMPPTVPGAALTNTVTIAWDRNPDADYYLAVDTNGTAVPLLYRVRQSYSITNPLPWPVVAETTNSQAIISNLTAQTHFWYLTASNFFLESGPSSVLSLPFNKPSRLQILIP